MAKVDSKRTRGQRAPGYLPLVTSLLAFAFAMGCDSLTGGKKKSGSTGSGFAGQPQQTQSPTPGSTSTAGIVFDKLVVEALAKTEIYTKDNLGDNCLDVNFTVKNGDTPVKGAEVAFTMEVTGPKADGQGKLENETAISDDNGIAKAIYCSGEAEVTLKVIAQAGIIMANSASFSVVKRPFYKIEYVGSQIDIDKTSAGDPAAVSPAQYVDLNILDSGPTDCTQLYFRITRVGAPVMGEKLTVRTQVDYPKGAKLAKKTETGLTEIEAATGKRYAYYNATSNADGMFIIPVCAGLDLGTLLVSGEFLDSLGKKHKVQAPLIRFNAGLITYRNMSVTHNPLNARTLLGYFNTNSEYALDFRLKAGAKQDGSAITEFPFAVYAETGKIMLDNNGYPAAETGLAKFTMQALHMVDYRPHQIHLFNAPEAQTRCDPYTISLEGGISYKNLSQNWRSTVVYTVRGQESYNDANHNGRYDAGGDGFWDKNQNGKWDAGEMITFDAGGDNVVDPNGEWFIDLPTPFIDVDEDNTYNSAKDILIGDEYSMPNGKRDADALLWKYIYVPIYMGASAYSMTHGVIENPLSARTQEPALDYMRYAASISQRANPDTQPLIPLIYGPYGYNDTTLWGPGASHATRAGGAARDFFFYAHGVCGNPPPGQTEITINIEDGANNEYGIRKMTSAIWMQPADKIRESSRTMLAASGGSSAKINFDIADHPSAQYGYPIEFDLEIAPCYNQCTGDALMTPGVACGAQVKKVTLTMQTPLPAASADAEQGKASISLTSYFDISEVVTCACHPNIHLQKGVCACPANTAFDSTTNKCVPN